MRKLSFLLAWLSLSAVSYSQSLVAYYPFNGNANDQSGNAINPTYIGSGVTLTTDRFGNANKAYNFDGAVGSYMRMPADLMPFTNRTISLWFNVPDVTNRPGLLGYGGNGSCGTTLLMGLNCTGTGQYWVQGHCGYNAAGYTYPAAPVNNWYHWVLTISGSYQKIYINGQLKSTNNTFSGSTAVVGKDFSLGVITSISGTAPYTDANVGYLTGKLDDVRIYDNAMTDAQVLQLYQNESTGLVAYYPFNSNANDESGNGRNGIVMNGVYLTTDRFNNANSAYYFDGDDDLIELSAAGLPSTDRTVMFWLNPDAGNQPSYPVCYGGSSSCGYSFLTGFNASSANNYNTQGHCGSNALGTNPWTASPANTWVHYAVTISGSSIRIYINGQLAASNNGFSNTTYVDGKKFFIGALITADGLSTYDDGSGGNFKGKLDDVRIYDIAMTDAKVLQLYQNESTGLVAYYPFNNNANDESGNSLNLTNNGAALTSDRFGNANSAYYFNGSAKMFVDDNDLLDLTGDFAISFWIKRQSTDLYQFVMSKHFSGVDNTGSWGIANYSAENLSFKATPHWGDASVATPAIPQNVWKQVIFTYNKTTSEWRYYIDGILGSSGTKAFTIQNTTNQFILGACMPDNYHLIASLDEIKIYNRQLSEAEVLSNYKGLVAYYPFNGNANDETGNNHNGTVSGATLTTDRKGNANSAYVFNGSSDFIQISGGNTLTLPQYTYSAWFYLNAYPAGVNLQTASGVILDAGSFAADQYIHVINYNPYYGIAGSGYYSGGGSYDLRTGTLPNLNQWYHMAVTRSSSEYKLYVNGALVQTVAITTAGPDYGLTPEAVIGKRIGDLQYFNGKLDDIRIYNRSLSPNEIAQLADIPFMPDLLAYLPMNGNANDMSGNGRHGTTCGATTLITDKYSNSNSAYNITNPNCGISLSNTTSLDLVGQPFAISAWVKYSNIPAGDFPLVAKHNCGTPNGYVLSVYNNYPRFYLCAGGNWSIISSPQTYNDNKWHHLVATYDGIGTQKLYVDGLLKASAASVVYNTPGSGAPVVIGYANNCGQLNYTGSIDEVKIYGAGLEDAQVTALYKQSRGSGNAMKLGSNSYIDIGNLGAPHFFTIEAWIKRNDNGVNQHIISGNNANSWSFGADGNRLFVSMNGTSLKVTSADVPQINDGKWHHVAVAFQDGPMNFYVDGVHAGWVEIGTSGLTASNYSIGTQFTPGNTFNGEIDEIRIWDWVLDADNRDTIRSWMNRKITPSHPVYSNLVRYYNFDEKNVTKTYDMAAAATGIYVNGVAVITSGAAIGDISKANFSNPMTHGTTLVLNGSEQFSVSEPANYVDGASIYAVKDPPEVQTGILGLGSNDHYFGVHISTTVSPTLYTATYNYTGNPFVSTSTEPTLQLFKRADNSATTWANSGATLNTTANTLTVTGQNTEYILGSSGFGLPVTLLSFEAKKINATTTQLNWKTSQEINNKGFEIQRSFDGSYFVGIGFVNGAGNADVMKEYSLTDIPGKTGRVYYRLKQVDFDEQSKLSQIVSVVFDRQGIIKVYPNPALHQVTIEGADLYNRIRLIDAAGKVVREQITNGQYQLSMSLEGLKSGMYLLQLSNSNESRTLKLIIGN